MAKVVCKVTLLYGFICIYCGFFSPTRFQHMVCACLWQVNWQFWNLAAIFLSLSVRHLPLNNVCILDILCYKYQWADFCFLAFFCCVAIAFDYHNSMVEIFLILLESQLIDVDILHAHLRTILIIQCVIKSDTPIHR